MNNPPRRLQTTLLPQLDGLRGIAVLLVLWFHFPFIAGSPGSQAFTDVGHKIRSGTIGVDVFFALSGFLITRILINERVITGTISFSNFYFKRSLRIFPAYYISIIFCIIMFRLPDQEMVYNLLYLTNYNLANYMPNNDHSSPLAHTWSLAVEEQFYLLWPLLLAFVPMRHVRMTTAVVVPAIAVGTMVLTCLFVSTLQADALIFGATPIRMLTLSFGAYLACREHDRSPLSGRQGYALIVLAVCWLFATQVAREWDYTTSPVYHSLGTLGFAFLALGVLASILQPRFGRAGVPQRMLKWRPLRYVGRISYGLYLYHYVILRMLATYDLDAGASPKRVCLAVGLTFATAVISFHMMESPLQRLGRRSLTPSALTVDSDVIPLGRLL